jgi:hypothetical protein
MLKRAQQPRGLAQDQHLRGGGIENALDYRDLLKANNLMPSMSRIDGAMHL